MMSDGSYTQSMATNFSTCVGRDYELDELDAQFREALATGASVCLVTGDTGSGKSTLVTWNGIG
jgi:Tfp pilus assembly pilus retraction ATPase PilT